MSASKSTSLMRDFTSLPEFDLMFMFAGASSAHLATCISKYIDISLIYVTDRCI